MKLLLLGFASLMLLAEVSAMAQTPAAPTSSDQAALVQGNNAFALDLYGKLRAKDGNLFFSPESISTALAMAYSGAHGATAVEMASTLHFTLPPAALGPAMGALLKGLNASHTGYQLHVADALWAEKDFSFDTEYVSRMNADFGAGFNRVDFKSAPEAARARINQWVTEKTEGKIDNLIPPGGVNSATRMVLTNAIYFKGDWETQFNKTQTQPEDFHVGPQSPVKAAMMHRTGRFNYFDGGTFQALEIPYKTGELSMIVLLPNDAAGLPALEEAMTAEHARQWIAGLNSAPKVILTLPKFKMTREFELADTLGSLGMRTAFERGVADFSGMTGKPDLWISAVIHKAFVDVNEEGTEAAAATGVITSLAMARRAEPERPIVFRADHPFVFMIRDNQSGGILFMGRVSDPTK